MSYKATRNEPDILAKHAFTCKNGCAGREACDSRPADRQPVEEAVDAGKIPLATRMSRHHLEHAWKLCMDEDLTAGERCVLMAIAWHINAESNQWRIGIHLIAEEAGLNASYTKRVITSLRRKGVLASDRGGNDRACTWWIPAVPAYAKGANNAPSRARKPRPEEREERDGTSAESGVTSSAESATNTKEDTPMELPGAETVANHDGLSPIELQYIASQIDKGTTKAEAVRNVLAIRARREGSREHGTTSGRAPLTKPVQSLGQVFTANGIGS